MNYKYFEILSLSSHFCQGKYSCKNVSDRICTFQRTKYRLIASNKYAKLKILKIKDLICGKLCLLCNGVCNPATVPDNQVFRPFDAVSRLSLRGRFDRGNLYVSTTRLLHFVRNDKKQEDCGVYPER